MQEEWCIPDSSFGLVFYGCLMLYFDQDFFFEIYFVILLNLKKPITERTCFDVVFLIHKGL